MLQQPEQLLAYSEQRVTDKNETVVREQIGDVAGGMRTVASYRRRDIALHLRSTLTYSACRRRGHLGASRPQRCIAADIMPA